MVAVPVQLLAVGVTVTVDVIGVVPVLVAVKDAISPIPLAAKPVAVLVLVQLNVVPVTFPTNETAADEAPLQIVWSVTGLTVGVGFTVISNELTVPMQLLAVGVTVIVPVMAELPVLVPVNEGIELPIPFPDNPIFTFEFAQS